MDSMLQIFFAEFGIISIKENFTILPHMSFKEIQAYNNKKSSPRS